tara:strand:- start:111 stop:440 length:330 start_codon:yes stop_codon:yes gene_type:complete
MDWGKYDSKKTKKTGAFSKQSEVTKEAVSEVKDDDGKVVKAAQAEEKREFLAYVEKRWDGETGEAQADLKQEYSLGLLENEKARFQAEETRAKAQVDGLTSAIADFKKL